MKTALIIGINGNFGAQMALALREQGWAIRALMRDPAKAPAWLSPEAIVTGQAQDKAAVMRAADGVELFVYAANPPYHRWPEEAMAMLEPALQVAEQLKLQVVFPGNVYAYAPQAASIDERVAMAPPTEKGVIRQQMEQRLRQATERGARVLLVRAGDFIGPNTTMTWLDLIASVKGGKVKLKLPHDDQHVHYYTYLPDLCANTAQLLNESLLDWEVFHDPGLALGKSDWQNAFLSMGVTARISAFPWWGLRLAAMFSPLLKEVMKMRYLWRQTVIMNGDKLIQRLGDRRQATALPEVVRETLFKQ